MDCSDAIINRLGMIIQGPYILLYPIASGLQIRKCEGEFLRSNATLFCVLLSSARAAIENAKTKAKRVSDLLTILTSILCFWKRSSPRNIPGQNLLETANPVKIIREQVFWGRKSGKGSSGKKSSGKKSSGKNCLRKNQFRKEIFREFGFISGNMFFCETLVFGAGWEGG